MVSCEREQRVDVVECGVLHHLEEFLRRGLFQILELVVGAVQHPRLHEHVLEILLAVPHLADRLHVTPPVDQSHPVERPPECPLVDVRRHRRGTHVRCDERVSVVRLSELVVAHDLLCVACGGELVCPRERRVVAEVRVHRVQPVVNPREHCRRNLRLLEFVVHDRPRPELVTESERVDDTPIDSVVDVCHCVDVVSVAVPVRHHLDVVRADVLPEHLDVRPPSVLVRRTVDHERLS